MNLSGPFIRRPVATMLLSLAIMLLGGVSFNLLPVSPLPQIDFPVIVVSASLPGVRCRWRRRVLPSLSAANWPRYKLKTAVIALPTRMALHCC